MCEELEFAQAVQTLTQASIEGTAFRSVNLRYLIRKFGDVSILDSSTALSAIGSIKNGGRYNLKGEFEALYLSDDLNNALLEVDMMRQTSSGLQGIPGVPRVLLSVEYHIQNVLDFVDINTHRALGLTLETLKAPWRNLNAQGKVATTQLLGKIVHDLGGIEALRVPSAKRDDAYNLVIFPDRLSQESFVRIYDSDGYINATLP